MSRRTPPPTPAAPPFPHDAAGLPLRLRDVDLDRFFHPRTVVVIGASDAEGRPNTGLWRKIHAWGQRTGARVVPVHPTRPTVDGVPCHASVHDVEGDLDLAVLLVGDPVDVFASVLEREPAFAVIFSAGFAEVGAAGARLQRRLEALVAAGPTRLLGPNTNLNAFESFRDDLPGPTVALITQSGHQGRPVFEAQQFGLALSHWAPTGNEADLEFADFARWFADQPEVGAIAAYVEGFADGRTLQLAADHAARRQVPIVCVKVGRTDAGASMARSHTGHLMGSDAVVDAVFRQYGITRVDGLDELVDVAATFTRTREPRGRGVCIYSISGGTGAHMADLCAGAGLELPALTRRTQRALRQWIPGYLRVSNPVDNGGPPSTDERGRKIIDAILADPNVDAVICPLTGALETISRPLATDLVAAAAESDKPVFVVWGSPDLTDPVYTDVLVPSGLPLFRTFGNCVRSVQAWFDYWDFQDRYRSPFTDAVVEPSPAAARAGRLLAPARDEGRALSEVAAKALLRAYGIRTSRDVLCASAAEAGRAAARLGLPVVLKVASPDLLHKSEHGLVAVGLSSAAQVRRTYAELLERAHRSHPGATIDGVLVCEQVTGGVECVVGVGRDELFGPTVLFGLGGVLVEVLADVAVRVPPFGADEARRMIDEVRGSALLHGTRGAGPVDVDALVDVVLKVQRLAVEQADAVAELDINPLLVRRRGAVALDALVVPA